MNLLRALVIFSLGSTSWVHGQARELGELHYNGCEVDNNCCKGTRACEGIAEPANAYFSVAVNSCMGTNACLTAARDDFASMSVAESACVGYETCMQATRSKGSYSSIAKDSCHGEKACFGIADGGNATVGQRSCLGTKGCNSAGTGYIDPRGSITGSSTIGSDSCKGESACSLSGQFGEAVIGDNSCSAQEACFMTGRGDIPGGPVSSKTTIGDNSCNAKKACWSVGKQTGIADSYIFIGSNSCNCPDCCTCLEANDVVPDDKCNERGPESCCLADGQRNAEFDFATTPPGANGDPIILGLKNQVFKFEGRDGAWYSNLSSKNVQWNMQFKEFDSCPADENMFISGMSVSTSDNKDKAINSDILIVTTPEPIAECREDPNLVCLGEGTLHISFDGGKTFVSQPGDYHFSSRSRVVAHNTYAACSRKWHDYEVSASETSGLRDGGRRATVQEKKPLQLLLDKKLTMIDPSECNVWIEDRDKKNDIFQQRGHWSTMYIETPLVSFHIEYRRSDWFDPKCDFQSLDAWMTNVSGKMEKTQWHGILGETKTKVYDLMTGKQIKTDRSKLLRGKEDSDYEVTGPFDTKFAALGKHNGFNKVISSIIESGSKQETK